MTVQRLFHPAALALGLALLAACSAPDPVTDPLEDLGPFRLSHNIVLTERAEPGPLSREADLGELQQVMVEEIDRRFSRYDGTRLYHLGVNVDAYLLALPGIPVVANPRSALIFTVNVWDDALQRRLNEEPHRITVLESATGETLLGSGLTQTGDEQMRNLAINAARAIERWLAENPEWFEFPAEGAAAAATPAP